MDLSRTFTEEDQAANVSDLRDINGTPQQLAIDFVIGLVTFTLKQLVGDSHLAGAGNDSIVGHGRIWGDYFDGGSDNDTMVGVDFNRVLDYGLDLAAGDNSILFTIDGSTGVLGFISALTYTDTITEDDNLHTVTLMVTDGTAVTSLTVDVVVAYEVTATPGQTLINFNSNFSGKVCAAGAKATSLKKSQTLVIC